MKHSNHVLTAVSILLFVVVSENTKAINVGVDGAIASASTQAIDAMDGKSLQPRNQDLETEREEEEIGETIIRRLNAIGRRLQVIESKLDSVKPVIGKNNSSSGTKPISFPSFPVNIPGVPVTVAVPGSGGVLSSVPVPAVPAAVTDTVNVLPGVGSIPGFSSNDTVPDDESGGFIVSSDPNDIRFLLFSDPSNPDSYEVLEYGDLGTVKGSKYDPAYETKFLVHGFQNNLQSVFPQNGKNAYLGSGRDLNIIVVDWGKLAIPDVPVIAPVFYPLVVTNVWKTGVRLGEFISWLKTENLIDLSKTHVIGFSLGSHVSGKGASDVQEKFNETIARVTALDPAGPEFYTGIFARKLTPKDADFVDAYHTNAGQLGIWLDVGKADFYINGGTGPQPGCLGFDSVTAVLGSVTKTVAGTCSHAWATEFFSNTIGSGNLRSEDQELCACTSLTGYKLRTCSCDKRVIVGEYSPFSTSGTHYLDYRFEKAKKAK